MVYILSIKVVSFDVWNTLLDIDKFYRIIAVKISVLTKRNFEEIYSLMREAYKEALRERLEGRFKRIIIDSADYFAKKIGVEKDLLFKSLVKALSDEDIKDLLYDDVVETLERLREKELKLAIIGNVMFWPGMVNRYILYKNNVLDYFDVTIFSDEINVIKPDKEIFEYIASSLNVRLNEMAHVGDSVEHDLAGAVLNGVLGILIRRDVETPILRLGSKAYLINDLRRLIDLFNII